MPDSTNRPFIDPSALAAVRARLLFYPVAGEDWCEFLCAFGGVVDEFHFCDIIIYQNLRSLQHQCPFGNSPSYRLLEFKIEGKHFAPWKRETHDLEPGRLIQLYERKDDAQQLTIVRRREFGECALSEFADRSIGVFVHRGDSQGEGGSNLSFLAETPLYDKPLYDKLSRKLADTALVVSDGSLAEPSFLTKFHPKTGHDALHHQKSGFNAYQYHKKEHYRFGTFDWRCVGYLGQRNGPTLVWQLTRS